MEQITLDALNRAITKFNGAPGLARAMDLPSEKAIHAWKLTRIPAEHCPVIEKLSGERCEDLRPDVLWHVLRARPRAGRQAIGNVNKSGAAHD